MKPIILIALSLSITGLRAATDPAVAEFLKIEPAKVREFLDRDTILGSRTLLISAAIQARRTDLLVICFNLSQMAVLTAEAVAEMPDSDYRDQLTLMMLKTDSYYWPRRDELTTQDYSGPGIESYFGEPYTGVLRKYFPGQTFTADVMRTFAKRTKLAADLEAAMVKAGSIEAPPERQPEEGKSRQLSNPHETRPPGTTGSPAKNPDMPGPGIWSGWLLWSFAGFAGVILLGLVIKKRGS